MNHPELTSGIEEEEPIVPFGRLLFSFKRTVSNFYWWAWEDLNFRPLAYQASALAS